MVLVQKFHSLRDMKGVWVFVADFIAIGVLMIVTHTGIIIIQRRVNSSSAGRILGYTVKKFPLYSRSFSAKMIRRLLLIIIINASVILSLIIKDFSSGFLQLHHITVGIIVVVLIRYYLRRSLDHVFILINWVFNFLAGIVIIKVLVFHILAHYQSAMVSGDLLIGNFIIVVLSLQRFIIPFLVNLEV